jgi:hypothetical protein
MTEQDTSQHSDLPADGGRVDDRNDEIDESPAPDPDESGGDAGDDPGAD